VSVSIITAVIVPCLLSYDFHFTKSCISAMLSSIALSASSMLPFINANGVPEIGRKMKIIICPCLISGYDILQKRFIKSSYKSRPAGMAGKGD